MTRITYTTASDYTSSNNRLEPDESLTTAEDHTEVERLNLDPITVERHVVGPTTSTKETISLTIHSVGRGRFAAFLGDRLLCVSETPLLPAARVLQAEGISAATRLEMIHEGSATVAMRSTVGVAAGFRVSETGSMPRFVPWRPDQLPCDSGSACTVDEPNGQTAPSGPDTSEPKVSSGGAAATAGCDGIGQRTFPEAFAVREGTVPPETAQPGVKNGEGSEPK
jgi:hypothetical protein